MKMSRTSITQCLLFPMDSYFVQDKQFDLNTL